jgi:hypothetical protein
MPEKPGPASDQGLAITDTGYHLLALTLPRDPTSNGQCSKREFFGQMSGCPLIFQTKRHAASEPGRNHPPTMRPREKPNGRFGEWTFRVRRITSHFTDRIAPHEKVHNYFKKRGPARNPSVVLASTLFESGA